MGWFFYIWYWNFFNLILFKFSELQTKFNIVAILAWKLILYHIIKFEDFTWYKWGTNRNSLIDDAVIFLVMKEKKKNLVILKD